MSGLTRRVGAVAVALTMAACGGGGGLPVGSVVNTGGGSGPPPTKLVDVKVIVSIPPSGGRQGIRPDYVSVNTKSLVIELSSVNGEGATGVNPTTINTAANSHGCKADGGETVCIATASGSPGNDVFAVTTYQGTNATGAVLSVGSVQAKIADSGGNVPVNNKISIALAGVVTSLGLHLSPTDGRRGKPATSDVSIAAYDASGAQIVGPSDFLMPLLLAIEGDNNNAFLLHAGKRSGTSLSISKPTSGITLSYDGNKQASSVTVQVSVDGPSSINAKQPFTLRGKQPPPPVGTIYALNLGTNDGQGATITEYDGKASGNAAPVRTLQLDSKLYARGIAVDANDNLYVGYFDNQYGFSPSDGLPDARNEIAIYAPHASGNTQPTAYLTADKSTKSLLYPLYIAFDASGDLVTYGATTVDGNGGNDAVLIYSPGSSGAATPANAWSFGSPSIRYAGPTGLALDPSGNFYFNGQLHSSLGPVYGLFVAPASDYNNPSVTPTRAIPWDTTTELAPGLTRNVALSDSSEIYISNVLEEFTKSSYPECQGRVNVYAAGADGGSTDVPPLRKLTLDGVFTANPACVSYTGNALAPFFPSITLYGTTFFVADDFNNAVDSFPSSGNGDVKPISQIAGSATGLNAPIALVVTKDSERAKARPDYHR